jgi:hypothetical protein
MNGSNQDLGKKSSEQFKKECRECGKICKNKKSLGCHIGKSHGTKQYYDKFIKKENEGKCLMCGGETSFVNIDRGYRKTCGSKECISKRFQGERNPFYGKKHSEKIKEKIKDREYKKGENHHFYGRKGKENPNYGRKHTEEELKKMSEAMKGRPPNPLSPEGLQKIINTHKGKKLSKEHKKKISESNVGKHIMTKDIREKISKGVAEAHIRGDLNQPKQFKSGYFVSNKFNKKFWYRSSYELKALQIFENNPEIVSLEYETKKIKVKINGEFRYCVPDYWISYNNGAQKIIEIKPKKMLTIKKVAIKIDACKEYFKEKGQIYEVWTEKELGING